MATKDVYDKMLESVHEVLQTYGTAIVDSIKEKLIAQGKHASGNLLGSINFKIVKLDGVLSLQISAADYLQWVETGRSSGTYPNLNNILKWIQAKGIQNRGIPAKSKVSVLERQKQLAFSISRKIKAEGIPPAASLQPALDSTSSVFNVEIGKAVVMSMGNLVGNAFAEAVNEYANKKIRIKTNF